MEIHRIPRYFYFCLDNYERFQRGDKSFRYYYFYKIGLVLFSRTYMVHSSIVDSNKRHVAKTFTWRGIGTLDTVLFGWLLTGSPLTGLKIGGLETFSKMLLYYGHEKFWYKINYGLDKRKKPRRLNKLKLQRKLKNL